MHPKKFTLLFCLISAIASAQFKSPQYTSNSRVFKMQEGVSEKDYLLQTLLFKVKPQYRSICSLKGIENLAFQQLLQSVGAKSLSKKFPFHNPPAHQFNEYNQKLVDLSLIYEFKYTAEISVEILANKLLKLGLFEYAEPHYLPHLDYQPNDPMATTSTVSGQYHLGKINAYLAWDVSKGDTNVVIGITDTGVEPTHLDLFANIKHNYNDPIDGIDNDGDSLIDNFNGWDVGMNDNDPTYQSNAHGVHVSGCAAASTDNLTGVAGVGFNCKFLPVKISDASGALISAYEGIIYAADHGCSIINCSWGGYGGSQFGQNAIDYATFNKNSLVVCAAGNDNISSDHFPSAYNNALSVASTTSGDSKSSFSNYGYTIDVCAPGSQINATYAGGSYQKLSGTSMASPIAAGAAAIVKSMFPSYSALQIGEQLKATCDAISASTSGTYANKLGKGRVNLFQGITNTNTKSVTVTSRAVVDGNDNAFVGNDTLQISTFYTNFLAALTNLNITLSSTSSYVTILNPSIAVGAMTTMQLGDNSQNPFLVKLNPLAPPNTSVTFKVNFTDGSYSFNYLFNVVINVDYINVTVNDISTTITSKGRIGFNSDSQADGLGFKYKNGRQLVYEAGLMLGKSSNAVSDMVRGVNAGTGDADFSSIQAVRRNIPSVYSDFDLFGIFNDAVAPSPIGVRIKHKAFAWNTPGNTKYVIVEYKIANTSNATLSNIYAGIFADWDIDDSTYASNRAEFDAINRMGYAYYTGTNGTYVGIKLLSNSAPVLHYAIDNVGGGGGGVDLTAGGFDEAEKYTTLSTNRASAGVNGAGADIIDVVSTGPLTIIAGDSVAVAYALLAGDNLTDLQLSAANAQLKYDSLYAPLAVQDLIGTQNTFTVFPNPFNKTFSLYINAAASEIASLEVFALDGHRVISMNVSITAGKNQFTLNESAELSNGLYFIKLSLKNTVLIQKLIKE